MGVDLTITQSQKDDKMEVKLIDINYSVGKSSISILTFYLISQRFNLSFLFIYPLENICFLEVC